MFWPLSRFLTGRSRPVEALVQRKQAEQRPARGVREMLEMAKGPIATLSISEYGICVLGGASLLKAMGHSPRGMGIFSALSFLPVKPVVGDLVKGLVVLLRSPFSPGDRVKVGTSEGTVERMGADFIVLKGPNGARVYIPSFVAYNSVVHVLPASP